MEASTVNSPSTGPVDHHMSEKTVHPSKSSSARVSRLGEYFLEPVRPSILAEFELVLLTFSTGIQDAIAFPDYHCFASNQTGNTVFLMLAIVLPQFDGEVFFTANIGAALGFFIAGGWLTGQLGHLVGPRQRWWLVLCNLIQTGLVFGAAALQQIYGAGGSQDGPVAIAGLSLLAFASGSQVVQSRSLAMPEISTAMATAAWVDLMIDPRLLAPRDNRPRNRRAVFLAALVLGALTGAGIYKTAGSAAALFIAAALKALVAIFYLFNGADKPPPPPPSPEADCEAGSACSTAPQTRQPSIHEQEHRQ